MESAMDIIEKLFRRYQRQAFSADKQWELTLSDFQKAFSLKCAESGVKMTLNPKQPNTASIDRINNKLDYVPGNVRFVCWCLNRGKGNLSLRDWNKIRLAKA